MPSKEEMLDILWSKDQIRDLGLRYCRAVDRADWPKLEACYHPEALDEHGFNRTNSHASSSRPRRRCAPAWKNCSTTSPTIW